MSSRDSSEMSEVMEARTKRSNSKGKINILRPDSNMSKANTTGNGKINLSKDIENSKKKKTGDTESCSESENDFPHHTMREKRLAAKRSKKFRDEHFPE